jgi:predicted secreted hydrolase
MPRATVTLPADDAVLPDPLMQWWYWTGHLEGEDGRRFGFEVVFFLVESFHDHLSGQMAQAAVSDLDADVFVDEQFEAAHRPPVLPDAFRLDAGNGTIRADGGDGRDTLAATVKGYELELRVTARRPPTLHYGGERHDYGFGGNTCYYSRGAMDAAGSVRTPDGERHAVTGTVWFDRQYGELVPAVLRGWQWFAIQLDNDTQVMLFAFNRDPSEWMGSITGPDGATHSLTQGDFTIDILDWWVSPRSHIRYPHGWRVKLPDGELEIRPAMADQEMAGPFWIGPRYWEGACDVTGTAAGRAYVELVGFAYYDPEHTP